MLDLYEIKLNEALVEQQDRLRKSFMPRIMHECLKEESKAAYRVCVQDLLNEYFESYAEKN